MKNTVFCRYCFNSQKKELDVARMAHEVQSLDCRCLFASDDKPPRVVPTFL